MMSCKMLAILYLLICTACGFALRRKLLPSATALLFPPGSEASRHGSFLLSAAKSLQYDPVPLLFFEWPAAFLLGTIPLSTLLYFLSALSRRVGLRVVGSSLLGGNLLLLCLLTIGLLVYLIRHKKAHVTALSLPSPSSFRHFFSRDSLRKNGPLILTLIFILYFCSLLFYQVFYTADASIYSGRTVVSDYSAHLANISAFARGENYAPSDYPFFSGSGMRYHFFFFFLAANLHALGLSLTAALNLLSSLGLVSFGMLMGFMAYWFSGRRSAIFWIQPLIFWQSSLSAFFFLAEAPKMAAQSKISIWQYIVQNRIFIGRLHYDEWGLWNLNVFANQRHLPFVLAAALLVWIVLLPFLGRMQTQQTDGADHPGAPFFAAPIVSSYRHLWISSGAWLPADWKPFFAAALLLLCLPYWHGAVTIVVLLILFVCALFARGKLGYLFLALSCLGATFIYSSIFSGSAAAVVTPAFQWGFLSSDKSIGGVLSYIWELLGLAGPALLLLPWLLRSREKRRLSLSFVLPLILAFCLSLTPDINVNHKYILIARYLGCLPLVTVLGDLWHSLSLRKAPVTALLARFLSLVCAFMLVISGLLDHSAYKQANKLVYGIRIDSPFIHWLTEETDPRAIFLTPPWHYSSFFYSGRQVYYGHAYFSWSAGYASFQREREVDELWSGCGGDFEKFKNYIREHRLQYAIITDDLRSGKAGLLDEAFFVKHFPLIAAFPDEDGMSIFDLRPYLDP